MSNTTVLNTLEWAYDWLRESSCSQELLEDIDERITEVKIEMRRSVKQEPVSYIKVRLHSLADLQDAIEAVREKNNVR